MTIWGFQPAAIQTSGIGLRMFSQDELQKIHLATLDDMFVDAEKAVRARRRKK